MPTPSLHPDYPSPSEIDHWCEGLITRAEAIAYTACAVETPPAPTHPYNAYSPGATYVALKGDGPATFYAYWQPVIHGGPAPLLVRLSAGGQNMVASPGLVRQGYNVLSIAPMGYATPEAPNNSHEIEPHWRETYRTRGSGGWADLLVQDMVATRWALEQPQVQPERLALFGGSDGGGAALLLGSLLHETVRAIAADRPFLTGFHLLYTQGPDVPQSPRGWFNAMCAELPQDARENAWRVTGLIDTLSHAHRLDMPVLLTANAGDPISSATAVHELFECLPGTRSCTLFQRDGHWAAPEAEHLQAAWFAAHV